MINDAFCGPRPDGETCWHPAHSCPFHTARPASANPEATSLTDDDVHALALDAIRSALESKASPLQINRVMRSIRMMDQMQPTPMSEERILREVSLRGLIMAGLTPRTEAEWALTYECFDDQAIADLEQRAIVQCREWGGLDRIPQAILERWPRAAAWAADRTIESPYQYENPPC